MQMWPRFWKPLVIVIPSAVIVLAVLYMTYRFIDPIPPRHFVISAGMTGSGYDNFARQYARILARDGVELEVRRIPIRSPHPPGRITNNKLDSSWGEAYRPTVARKNQRHLVQKLNDDQMGSTPSSTNRGADGRVRVSDRDY
jgi:hypothetical protein